MFVMRCGCVVEVEDGEDRGADGTDVPESRLILRSALNVFCSTALAGSPIARNLLWALLS